MRPLRLHSELASDDSRKEVLRVWIDDGLLSVSLISNFPAGIKKGAEIWPIVLSDIFHHVADAIVLNTNRDGTFVRNQIRLYFDETLRSGRPARVGNVTLLKRAAKELNFPELSGTNNCGEIVRVFFSKNLIWALVIVGSWLPDEEEVWGNILYDLVTVIAKSMAPDDPDYVAQEIAERTIKLMDDPGTKLSGNFGVE